jgi:hypothetical protein
MDHNHKQSLDWNRVAQNRVQLWSCPPTRLRPPFHSSRAPSAPGPQQYRAFTIRHTTRGGIPLDEWSARRRDPCLAPHTHSLETDIHAPGGIRNRNSSMRASTGLRLRPRGHWVRLWMLYVNEYWTSLNICNILTAAWAVAVKKIQFTQDYLCADYLVLLINCAWIIWFCLLTVRGLCGFAY